MGWLGLELMGKQFEKYLSPIRKGWPCRRSGWGLTEEEERRVNAYCTGRPIPTHPLREKNKEKLFQTIWCKKSSQDVRHISGRQLAEDGSANATYVICSHASLLFLTVSFYVSPEESSQHKKLSLSISHRSDTLRLCFNSGQQRRFRLICIKFRWII